MIDLPQAALALHARALLLISAPAVALLNATELQAMAAHEIGHEYVWIEWNRARQRADRERLKELELICDAIAAVILRQLGMNPSKLIEGVEKVTRFNRERFGSATHENSYPTLGERRAFAREIDRWLRGSYHLTAYGRVATGTLPKRGCRPRRIGRIGVTIPPP
jgi:hypothetical protein